jgi:hypothetical protein
MLTIPGASPQSGTIDAPVSRACAASAFCCSTISVFPPEVAEVRARRRVARHVQVEVVRQRAHHRVALAHQRAHRLAVARVERRGHEARAPGADGRRVGVRREEGRELADVQVGEPHLLHVGILQQVEGAGRALQPRPENEHPHRWVSGMVRGMTASS